MDINKAKEFYLEMGCSHFHMARENPKKYEKYIKLNINEETENEWSIDKYNSYINKIKEGKFNLSDLWHAHSRICKLAQNINNERSHDELLFITKHISNFLPKDKWVIISENINGRSELEFRSGLIFQSFDSGFNSIAIEYLEVSRFFSQYIDGEGMDYSRCLNAQKRCNEIAKFLNL